MALRPVDLASKAQCDIGTARRWLKPELRASMKPVVAERIRRAAEELGHVEPVQKVEVEST